MRKDTIEVEQINNRRSRRYIIFIIINNLNHVLFQVRYGAKAYSITLNNFI